jgi:hypothetical protein
MENFGGELRFLFAVFLFVEQRSNPHLAVQESLPIFKALAELSKFMEGEKYILSSSYWVALSTIEALLVPNPADSPPVAALRAGMSRDHFCNRVTLEQSVQNPLHVLMHLLDHR